MTTALVWFRQDLRLADNPALLAAANAARHVVPVYIWSPEAYWRAFLQQVQGVDAGMREPWSTSWMHNRVRMITAFLVKNLLLPWQQGERWFWDTLVDADLASNALNWQWVAGTSPDATPWFRVFNPDIQAQKFDPGGAYRRRHVPEAGTPGYSAPIVDLKFSRQRALDAYAALRNKP